MILPMASGIGGEGCVVLAKGRQVQLSQIGVQQGILLHSSPPSQQLVILLKVYRLAADLSQLRARQPGL